MIRVYGASDDLIEIDGDIREEFGLSNDDVPAFIGFSDGTVLRVDYNGLWQIRLICEGAASYTKTFEATDPDADKYSDEVTLDGEILWCIAGPQLLKKGDGTKGNS